jgi:indole-3-acetate monooxygenase
VNPKDIPPHALTAIDQDWLALARSLMPLCSAAGPGIDATKTLPAELLNALIDAKMFRMLLPRSLGGAELDMPTFFQVVLAIAEGDASVGWTVAQSNGCAMAAAYMDAAAASEVFADPRAVLAWGFPAGPCRATAVEGGWRVTGSWGFGSGSRHSTWVGGHCQIFDANGVAQTKPEGGPVERTVLMPRADVTITDSAWNVIGLRGTGSDTYAVTDMFVPAKYCVVPRGVGRDQQLAEDALLPIEAERREAGPLYRFSPTLIYQAGFSAVALGIARAMLKSFIDLASKKTPGGGPLLLRDNAVIQEHVAVSTARLDAMVAWLSTSLKTTWDSTVATGVHAFDHRITVRLASTYAVREAARVVEDVYTDAGATAIFEVHPFERRLRDMHAVSQQVQSNPQHFQTVGQHYLGLKPSMRFI